MSAPTCATPQSLRHSSISSAGNIGQTNYAAAKAGVAAMTVTWAKELARYKIRVAGIAPGFCDTRMVANIKPEINPVGQSKKPPADWNVLVTLGRADIPGRALMRLADRAAH